MGPAGPELPGVAGQTGHLVECRWRGAERCPGPQWTGSLGGWKAFGACGLRSEVVGQDCKSERQCGALGATGVQTCSFPT